MLLKLTTQNGGKDGSGSNFLIPKGLSNFFHKNVPLKGTLTRNKNKEKHSVSFNDKHQLEDNCVAMSCVTKQCCC